MGGGKITRPGFGLGQPDPGHPMTEFYTLLLEALSGQVSAVITSTCLPDAVARYRAEAPDLPLVFLQREGPAYPDVMYAGFDPERAGRDIAAYVRARGGSVAVIPSEGGKALPAAYDADAVYLESPNYFGLIEDISAIAQAAHAEGCRVIAGCNPVALALKSDKFDKIVAIIIARRLIATTGKWQQSQQYFAQRFHKITPSHIFSTRSHMPASDSSWVTITNVCPNCSRRSKNN